MTVKLGMAGVLEEEEVRHGVTTWINNGVVTRDCWTFEKAMEVEFSFTT